MKPWALTETHSEGKFLVVRRDGTIPEWPHFVLSAYDPATSSALLAYAETFARHTYTLHHNGSISDDEFKEKLDYAKGVHDLAVSFAELRATNVEKAAQSDPEAPPHRTDDPTIIDLMRRKGKIVTITDIRETIPFGDMKPEFTQVFKMLAMIETKEEKDAENSDGT